MTSAAVALSKWWSAHHILQKIAIYFQLIYAFLYFAFFQYNIGLLHKYVTSSFEKGVLLFINCQIPGLGF